VELQVGAQALKSRFVDVDKLSVGVTVKLSGRRCGDVVEVDQKPEKNDSIAQTLSWKRKEASADQTREAGVG
jgi:hypothetical protein